jgi:hypothetical protein
VPQAACEKWALIPILDLPDAIAVAEQPVAGRDRHGADRDRFAVAVGNSPLDDVRRREERAEHRQALVEDEVGVARASSPAQSP